MGNKSEITTIDGMRRAAYASIDALLNSLPTNPDGTPVDEVRLHSESEVETKEDVSLTYHRVFGLSVKYKYPKLATELEVLVHTSDGIFRLLDKAGTDALLRFVHENTGASYYDMSGAISLGGVLPAGALGINELARRTNLLFERVALNNPPEEPYVAPTEGQPSLGFDGKPENPGDPGMSEETSEPEKKPEAPEPPTDES